FPIDRQCENERRSMRLVVLGPQPTAVRLDDRTADGQPHAHPVLFRGEERLEYLVRKVDALAAIAYFGLYRIPNAANPDLETLVAGRCVHRIHAVADEVDQNLLNLDAVERHEWKIAFDVLVDTDTTTRSFFGHEVARFGNDAGERGGVPRLNGPFEQGSDTTDDLRRRVGVTDDPIHDDLCALQIGWIALEPALTGVRV